MKRIYLLLAVLLAIGILVSSLVGCVGTIYTETRKTPNGKLTIGGRTGAFGTDQAFTLYEEDKPACPAPDTLYLERTYSRQATIQDYDQRCPDFKQMKNIHTRTENILESWEEEVPNPHKRPPQAQLVGGTNPSTGNLAVPALFLGAGQAAQGAFAPETKIITNATGGAGGKGGKGGAGGSSSSSSSSSAAAAAAAAAAGGH